MVSLYHLLLCRCRQIVLASQSDHIRVLSYLKYSSVLLPLLIYSLFHYIRPQPVGLHGYPALSWSVLVMRGTLLAQVSLLMLLSLNQSTQTPTCLFVCPTAQLTINQPTGQPTLLPFHSNLHLTALPFNRSFVYPCSSSSLQPSTHTFIYQPTNQPINHPSIYLTAHSSNHHFYCSLHQSCQPLVCRSLPRSTQLPIWNLLQKMISHTQNKPKSTILLSHQLSGCNPETLIHSYTNLY